MSLTSEYRLQPPVRLHDGRVIRTAAEALALMREQEARPGVDDRDEVLHLLERARDHEELDRAALRFHRWVLNLDMGAPLVPRAGDARGTNA